MGNFDDHMRYGSASYLLLLAAASAVVYLAYGIPETDLLVLGIAGAVIAFPFTVAGAGFPDIDHHASRPHRWFRKWFSVCATCAAGFLLVTAGHPHLVDVVARLDVPVSNGAGALAAAGVGAVATGLVSYFGIPVVKPRHRGITHTLRAGAVVAGLVAGATWFGVGLAAPAFALPAAGVAGVGFFVGFLSHLQCDGLLVSFLPSC